MKIRFHRGPRGSKIRFHRGPRGRGSFPGVSSRRRSRCFRSIISAGGLLAAGGAGLLEPKHLGQRIRRPSENRMILPCPRHRHLQAVSATDFPFSGSSYHFSYHSRFSRYLSYISYCCAESVHTLPYNTNFFCRLWRLRMPSRHDEKGGDGMSIAASSVTLAVWSRSSVGISSGGRKQGCLSSTRRCRKRLPRRG